MKKNFFEEKSQMQKNLFEEKPQMEKTNVENFKEVTHEIESMFFFRWKIDRL